MGLVGAGWCGMGVGRLETRKGTDCDRSGRQAEGLLSVQWK